MMWAGQVASMGSNINAHSVLVVKPEGKRSFGRPGFRRVIILNVS
jgi:hypothetical protein